MRSEAFRVGFPAFLTRVIFFISVVSFRADLLALSFNNGVSFLARVLGVAFHVRRAEAFPFARDVARGTGAFFGAGVCGLDGVVVVFERAAQTVICCVPINAGRACRVAQLTSVVAGSLVISIWALSVAFSS